MFSRILIANRGEIACRIIQTAQQLGIHCIAVYSEADANSQHVKLADEAHLLGPAQSSESYLKVDTILQIAQKTGAQAIHPGYGFLSENAEFAIACQQHDIAFIGPPAAAISAMGSKSAAKEIMSKADVPLVPGYHGDDQDPELLKAEAVKCGFPLLLKAVAGGGGKGMRVVESIDQFDQALLAAQREAKNAFGNSVMLLERYMSKTRHIEVQVFCDSLGNGIYLSQRDCSIQRRHQKIVEEAPAPGISEDVVKAMGEAALNAAKAINYVGAGTVEFLFNEDNSFYFMEMNTRLQVEHPVTEMVTNVDLVKWQLSIAYGEALPITQSQVTVSGHAIECRIYAEDPNNSFLPATGTLEYLRIPLQSDTIRVDTGVIEADEVSVYYDPMISKLIVWGEDRAQAVNKMSKALLDYRIVGVKNNIPFLHKV
ncbi:MAG: biotin carboxylase N-terminal domain-containing protein, partial [Oceanospirillaceae bacterium]